eukprot:353118-Chlamydomonas_euryale.AAC.5
MRYSQRKDSHACLILHEPPQSFAFAVGDNGSTSPAHKRMQSALRRNVAWARSGGTRRKDGAIGKRLP